MMIKKEEEKKKKKEWIERTLFLWCFRSIDLNSMESMKMHSIQCIDAMFHLCIIHDYESIYIVDGDLTTFLFRMNTAYRVFDIYVSCRSCVCVCVIIHPLYGLAFSRPTL